MRFYPAYLTQDDVNGEDEGYGIVFPDLPGCIAAGDTPQKAAGAAIEALESHIDGMVQRHQPLPDPSELAGPLPDWLASAGGRIVTTLLVPVEIPGRAVRAEITIDEDLLRRIDAAAAAEGSTRSGYLAQAARERMLRQ